jgi:ATP adenylyltransferase
MFAPWRRAFVLGAAEQSLPSPTGCIFCDFVLPKGAHPAEGTRKEYDRARLVVTVRERAFVILNKYPYNNGHILVVPRCHGLDCSALDKPDFHELHELLHESIRAIQTVYTPNAVNIGMNMGRAAGAGIEQHAHYHIVPRWQGDVNFMPVFSDVRIISEGLEDTYERLVAILRRPEEDA